MENKELKKPMELKDDALDTVSGGFDYSRSLVCSACGKAVTERVEKCPLCGGNVVVKTESIPAVCVF